MTTVPSPSHSKTNPVPGITWNSCHSTSLTGLEETPTACGMPLSFIAKSSPPSVLVKLQENLHKGNSTTLGFFIKDLKPPQRCWAHPFEEGIFVSFTAHPHDPKCVHTVLNLQENQRLEAHHRTQTSYTILPSLHDKTQTKSTLFGCPSHQCMHWDWETALACHNQSCIQDQCQPRPLLSVH